MLIVHRCDKDIEGVEDAPKVQELVDIYADKAATVQGESEGMYFLQLAIRVRPVFIRGSAVDVCLPLLSYACSPCPFHTLT